MTRFRDSDRQRYLWPMAERVLVACPRCGEQAEVLREGPSFACGRCGHVQRGASGGYLGMATATARRHCARCGRGLERRERRPGPHPAKVRVRCPGCAALNYVPVSWAPVREGDAYDPHFGFDLWLQTRCAGEVLWAYNAEHLAFVRDFVAAPIRERVPNANSSLASRLPAWIKLARNREAVLRAVVRLERRLGE